MIGQNFCFFFLGEVKRKKLEDRNSTVTWGFFFSGWIWKKKKRSFVGEHTLITQSLPVFKEEEEEEEEVKI